MGFQTAININPPLAVEGSFASAGVYHSTIAGVGQLKADTNGLIIARFAWANMSTGLATNVKPTDTTNYAIGFARRGDNTALLTNYLQEHSMTVPKGFPVTLYDRGDFWVKTSTAATIGQKVFASDTDGSIATDAAGATVTGYTETSFTVASIGAANGLIKISNI